jgi:hypothetical protein
LIVRDQELPILLAVGLGEFEIARQVPIFFIPQPTFLFRPPQTAFFFFAKNYDGGRIFSSAEIADMIDMYMPKRSPIFMDTRFDAFGEKLFRQYEEILSAGDNWHQLLDRYRVSWVFVNSDTRLALALAREPDWLLVHKDDLATIYRRR